MNMRKHSKNYLKNKFVIYEYAKSHYSSNEPLSPLDQSTLDKIKGILDIHKHRYYIVFNNIKVGYSSIKKTNSILMEIKISIIYLTSHFPNISTTPDCLSF